MKNLLTIILFQFLLSFNMMAQTYIKGHIVDRETGEKVLFASVSSKNTLVSTLTNENGDFIIPIDDLPAELVISHLNYGKTNIRIEENVHQNVELHAISIVLPEVQVGNYARDLVTKAARKLLENYQLKFYGKAFYRQSTLIDKEAVEWQEIIFSARSNNSRLDGSIIEKGRYAALNSIYKFEDFSFFTKAYGVIDLDTNNHSVISRNGSDRLNYRVFNLLKEGEREIAEVRYSCKPSKCVDLTEGSIFIDTESFDIVKMKFTVFSDLGVKLKNKHPLWTMRMDNPKFEFEMSFKELNQNRLIDFIKVNFSFDYVLKKETHKIEVSSLTYLLNSSTKVEDIMYESAKNGLNDRVEIKRFKYEPSFWVNNPIVERTPLQNKIISDLEKKGAFGNAILGNMGL
jgi:hypothetical protein